MGFLDIVEGNDPLTSVGTTTPTENIDGLQVGIEVDTLEELIQAFENSQDQLSPAQGVSLSILRDMYNTLGKENQDDVKEYIGRLAKAKNSREFQGYLDELRGAYERYLVDNAAVIDRATRQNALIQDEFLDDADLFGPSIQDRLKKSESMTLAQILGAAKSIELSGDMMGPAAWDYFFSDLENEVAPADLATFRKEIEEFKKEYAGIYNSTIDISGVSTSLDTQLTAIEDGSLDTQFQSKEGVTLSLDMRGMMEGVVASIGANISNGASMNIGPFHNKEEAAKTLYKIKLIFNQLETEGMGVWMNYYLGLLGYTGSGIATAGKIATPFDGQGTGLYPLDLVGALAVLALTLVGTVVATVVPIGIPTFFLGIAPLESVWRRFQGKVSYLLGDKGWGKTVNSASKGVTQAADFLGTVGKDSKWFSLKGLFIKLPSRALWIPTKATDMITRGFANLLLSAENVHLNAATLLTDNLLLIDGVQGNTGMSGLDGATSEGAIELRSRVKMLTQWEREFAYLGDTASLERLEEIKKKGLFVNNESFYIDLHKLIYGKLSDTSWSAWFTRRGIDIKNIMTIPNKKEAMVALHIERIAGINTILNKVYKNVGYTQDKKNAIITLPATLEYTKEVQEFLDSIDYGLLTHADEEARQKLFDDYLKAIQKGKTGSLTVPDFELDLRKIADGYLPRFRIIEEIEKTRATLSGNPTALTNLETFRKMVITERWWGKSTDLSSVLGNIGTTVPSDSTLPIPFRSYDDIKKEGKKLAEHSLNKMPDKSSIVLIDTYKPQLFLVEELQKAGVPLPQRREIEEELGKLFRSATQTTPKIDFTVPEMYFTIDEILSGKKFADIGDGRFGNTAIDFEFMKNNFSDFGQINVLYETRLLSLIAGKSDDDKIKFIQRVEKSTEASSFRGTKAYTDFVDTVKLEINNRILAKNMDLNKYKTTAINHMSGFGGSSTPDHGPTKNVTTAFASVTQGISTLEGEFTSVMNGTIAEKITFLDTVTNKLNTINSNVSNLETSIITWTAPAAAAPAAAAPAAAAPAAAAPAAAAPAAAAPAAAAPAAAATALTETPEETYNRVKAHLEGISYSVYSSGDNAAIKKFEEELNKINNKKYANLRKASAAFDLGDYYKSYFGIPMMYIASDFSSIRTEIFTKTALTDADLEFAKVQNLTDLGKYVASLTDTSLKGNIENILRGLSFTKK